ncbi:M24 family metallopeptidase [Roseobacteraceae bacterium S113]
MPFERGFPVTEFETRVAKAQAMMSRDKLDALLFMTEREFTYFAGFQSCFWQSPTRPWFLVIPADGKPVAVIPSIGAHALSLSWIDDLRVWASPNPEDEGISLLADTLKEMATRHGRIGVPLGPETHLRMPGNDVTQLFSALGGVAPVDATGILRALRMVKSEREIAKHAHVCALVSEAYENMGQIVRAGLSERDVVAAHRLEVLKRGADTVPYIVATAAQGGTDDAIRYPTDRPLTGGDVLFIDTGAEIDGYYCDFDRNFAIGHASDQTKRAYELVYRATDAGIAAARPGVRACDVWRAMNDVLAAGGAQSSSVGRMGHGVGLHNTEWPSLMSSDQTVLQEGMILAIEPGYDFEPGRMMLHEENVVVRAGGAAELLTRRAPESIPIL